MSPRDRGKLDVVVANWFPRFLANGLDYLDVRRTLDAIEGWADWPAAWSATADDYEARGRAALVEGHRVTSAEHLRRAALTLQFAQFVLTEEPERRRALQRRMVELYALAAPLLDPPATRVAISSGAGEVLGYLRLPTPPSPRGPAGAEPAVGRTERVAGGTAARPVTGERPGLVVLIPGLESTKEQFSTYEPFFLRRGLATLSVEGPGQGEAGWNGVFSAARFAVAMAAVGRAVAEFGRVDAQRVAVLGTSFGGHLALRYAPLVPGLRAVVDIAGPYDLEAFDDLQEVTREGFREFVGAPDLAVARRALGDVTLRGTLDTLDAPVLVVHGARDTIIPIAHAHRIVAELGERAHPYLEREGDHSCNNLATVVRPAVADWVADRLGGTT